MLEKEENFKEKENHRVFKQLLNNFIQSEQSSKIEEENISKNIKSIMRVSVRIRIPWKN